MKVVLEFGTRIYHFIPIAEGSIQESLQMQHQEINGFEIFNQLQARKIKKKNGQICPCICEYLQIHIPKGG